MEYRLTDQQVTIDVAMSITMHSAAGETSVANIRAATVTGV